MILCSMALEDLDSYWNGIPFVLSNTLGQRLKNFSFSPSFSLGFARARQKWLTVSTEITYLAHTFLAPEEQHVYRRAFHKRNLAP